MFQTLYRLRLIEPLMFTTLPQAENNSPITCVILYLPDFIHTNFKCQKSRSIIAKYSNKKCYSYSCKTLWNKNTLFLRE